MFDIRLVDDWRQGARWISVQAMAIAGAIQGAWMFIPADMKASIPAPAVTYLTLALLAVGIVGRFIQQGAQPSTPADPNVRAGQ